MTNFESEIVDDGRLSFASFFQFLHELGDGGRVVSIEILGRRHRRPVLRHLGSFRDLNLQCNRQFRINRWKRNHALGRYLSIRYHGRRL